MGLAGNFNPILLVPRIIWENTQVSGMFLLSSQMIIIVLTIEIILIIVIMIILR